MLAVDLVRRGAARFAGRTAVHFEDRSLTYAEVDEAANRLAHVLAGLGVSRGDRVGLLLGNGLWSVSVDFACLKADAARVPLNGRLSAAEHTRMLRDTGVTLLVYGPELAERALELGSSVAGLRLACLGGSTHADHLDLMAAMRGASAADPMLPAAPDDVILILYTSGTTGTLKAAQHTQASYAAITANILSNLVSPGRDDAMLHAASLIHAGGTFVLPYWVRGGASVVLGGFDPDEYLAAIPRYGVTAVNLVPTMLGMLFAEGRAERADLARLSTVVYGASPMPRPLIEHALDAWGPRFVQYFGQTEAPLCLTVLDKDDHAEGGVLLGAAGHPAVDAQLALTDEDGAPVAAGEIGEVRVKAPFAMTGYYNEPGLTAQSLGPDGWVRTRDLARFDDRGYLHLVDRSSDVIITGGYNVYPREVEDALASHPAVAQCAAVGAPDPIWVEAVTAFVTLRTGAEVSEAALREHVRARLAGYKVPKTVHFVDTIPYSPVGKILRRALRDPLWEGER
ncbi:AMP-binding protein [Streptomyces atratus]|uniref:class I adenylate-forming enzyme family protein n=1 Tax=Streptomyces atratus TaxID=1893 RepID=UPI002AC311DA|nr:AMP-binding protein [Streptomyces atratus]WPW32728.1 AMP-binding protein [Streptomyces atratus]